jgi:molybdopterin-containing oxidoreductase family iron-sulfur binding subunit
VVEKCHFCHHRFQAAKELARYEGRDPDNLPEDAWTPACVEMCPTGAMHFGDVNNPAHKVYKMSKSPHAARLLARLGTDPQVYYYSKRPWVLAQLDNYEHGGGPLDPDYGGHGETKDVKHGGGSHG